MSVITRSGVVAWNDASASSPSSLEATSYPSSSRTARITVRMLGESSTTRILARMPSSDPAAVTAPSSPTRAGPPGPAATPPAPPLSAPSARPPPPRSPAGPATQPPAATAPVPPPPLPRPAHGLLHLRLQRPRVERLDDVPAHLRLDRRDDLRLLVHRRDHQH